MKTLYTLSIFLILTMPIAAQPLSYNFQKVTTAQEAKDADRKRLLEIGQAMHAYVRQQGKFPPADMSLLGTHGQLSWRVGLLPYVGQQELYQKFNIQESWDSPHNLDLVKQMPDVYQSSGSILPAGRTNIVAPLGQGTTFDPRYRVGLRDVTDGTSNVAMLLRADASQAVIWTSPNDLQIDWNRPLGTLANQPGGEVPLLMVDGAVLYAPYVISPEMFRGLLKINDGGMIDLNSLKK